MNRGSAADPVARLGVILLAAATLVTGCAGLVRSEPVPLRVAVVRCEADVGPAPSLAAAPRNAEERGSRGLGLSAGAFIAPVSESGSRAVDGATYGDTYENGFGFGASLILRRPVTGTVSVGDIYLLGGIEFVTFSGRTVDNSTLISGWLDAKTMLDPLGGGSWKPYALAGFGITSVPSVTAGATTISEASIEVGTRGKLGIEWRKGGSGLYADIGIQLTTAPNVTNPIYGSAETIIYTPISAGLLLNF